MLGVNLKGHTYNVNKDPEEIKETVAKVEASDDFYSKVTLNRKTGYKFDGVPDDIIGLFEAWGNGSLDKEVKSIMDDELQRLMFKIIQSEGVVTDDERLAYNLWVDVQKGIDIREKYTPDDKPEYLALKDKISIAISNFEGIEAGNRRQTSMAVIVYFLVDCIAFGLMLCGIAEALLPVTFVSLGVFILLSWRLIKCFSSL